MTTELINLTGNGPAAQGDAMIKPSTESMGALAPVKEIREITAVHSALGHHHVLRNPAKAAWSLDGMRLVFVAGPDTTLVHLGVAHVHAPFKFPEGKQFEIYPQIQGVAGAQVAD